MKHPHLNNTHRDIPLERRREWMHNRAVENGNDEPERTLSDRLDEADRLLRRAEDDYGEDD